MDTAAYLERIGLPVQPEADAEGLVALQRAHRMAIPFENLDILLGRGITLDPDALFDKLVTRRRGGYCFEHNGLFLPMLRAFGFKVRPLLARVWLFVSDTPPRTHTLSLVDIEGQLWIADPGFGAGYTPPMPLVDGAIVATPDGAAHRLRVDPLDDWMLERQASEGEGWAPQYSFRLEDVWLGDLQMSNHYTATHPDSRFVNHATISVVLPNGFASLTDRHYSRASLSGRESGEIASAKAYRIRLSLMFGIDLTAEEVDTLGLFE